MSAIAKIRDGIIEGDWELVVEGYNQMAGAELVAPEDKSYDEEEVAARIRKVREKLESVLDILADENAEVAAVYLDVEEEEELEEPYPEEEDEEEEEEKPKRGRGRPKGSKNKKKSSSKKASKKEISEAERNLDSVTEAENTSVLPTPNKMKFITSNENSEEDLEIAERLKKVKKEKRPKQSGGKCLDCGKDTEYTIRVEEKAEYMCNDCALKRKGPTS